MYFHRGNEQPALENPAYSGITDNKKISSDCSSEPDTPSDVSSFKTFVVILLTLYH